MTHLIDTKSNMPFVNENSKSTCEASSYILTTNRTYVHYEDLCKPYYTHLTYKPDDISKVIFNPPATIVYWADGTKTVVKTQNNEKFDKEKGLTMAYFKKMHGNTGHYFKEIKKWAAGDDKCQSV